MSDLVSKLRAAIDRELERTDWPHRPSCQMLLAPPFPYDRGSCNCDAADTWMRLHEAMRKILELHKITQLQYGDREYYCETCDNEAYGHAVRERKEPYCPTLLALAGMYGIEVPA